MMRKYPTMRRGDYLDLTDTGHLLWMRDHNPDDWDDETWRAYVARCTTSPIFKDEARRCAREGLPRPHPTEDGWALPEKVSPLAEVFQLRSATRRERRK